MRPQRKKDKNRAPQLNLYGFHAVREAWLNEERTIHTLYITEQAQRGFEKTMMEAKNNGTRRPQPTIIEKHKLEKMLPKGAVHQGIGLSCTDIEEHDIQDFIIKTSTKNRVVLAMLDQVTDPHNVGAILRSASAFGIDGVIMQKKHAPALNGVLAKTACGAVDHIPVAHATNLSRAVEELKDNGFYVIGLDERGEKTIGDVQIPSHKYKSNDSGPLSIAEKQDQAQKVLLILGSEGSGIRRLVQESCDELVKLPTQGAIASLNVSNAAVVSFYALMHT